MTNTQKHIGEFHITARYKDGREETHVIKNRITNVALNKFVNILNGTDPDMEIKYCAVGTDNTAINDNDTTLGNEIFRTQDLSSSQTATGEFTSTFAILDAEAVGTWAELGIFCGSTATATADTGTMLSRVLFNFEKTSLVEVDITRVDKQVRG